MGSESGTHIRPEAHAGEEVFSDRQGVRRIRFEE